MNRATTLAVAIFLTVGVAQAQTSVGAQANAGASAQSQAGASKQQSQQQGSGAQVSGSGSASASANASAQAGQTQVTHSDGTTMNAALTGSLDASKSKPGDRVEARATQDVKQTGKVVVPKGTRLIGHIAQAQARTKAQSQSSLGVVFDYAEIRNGQQVPLNNVAIQALAVSQSAAQASAAGDSSADFSNSGAASVASAPRGGGLGGGGLVGGTLNTTSNTVGSVAGGTGHTVGAGASSTLGATHSAGAVGGLNAAGMLTSDSHGVFGLDGMSVDSAASGSTQGSMIVSGTRNVHLDSGTQMVLRAGAHAQ